MKSALYLSALFSGFLLLAARPVSAQETKMYMKAIASKQGEIKGEVVPGDAIFKGLIRLTNVSFNESASATGDVYRDKGVNKHEVLKVSKKVDDLSPQFLMAFSNNETFNEVLIDFANEDRSRNGTDKLAVFMSITLTGRVLISDFKQNGNSETISFSYTKMTVTEPTAAH